MNWWRKSAPVPDGPVVSSAGQAAAIATDRAMNHNNEGKDDMMIDLSQDSSENEEEDDDDDGIVDLSKDDDDEEDDDEGGEMEDDVKQTHASSSSSPSRHSSITAHPDVVKSERVKSEPDLVPSTTAARRRSLQTKDEEIGPDDEDEDDRKPAAVPDQESDDVDDNPFRERRSGVSGYGMFRSFKRTFKTGFMAMLDIFDNAVDATLDRYGGYIECFRDPDDPGTIIMHNNSDKPIVPVEEILNINQSSKRDREEDVGENGVGVKQACGYLSNLSFVLTKNRRQFSFGILSYELQTDDQPVLPSYVLPDTSEGGSLRSSLQDLTDRHDSLEQSLKSWGGGDVNLGLEFLLKKMEILEKSNDDYMFSLVIVKISMDPEVLLDDLKTKLPLYYIHIPGTLSIKVDGEILKARYWERRLVDLTAADLKISKKELYIEDPRWQDPTDAYKLRIFMGFDVTRAKKQLDTQLSMYIYSRKTGRLIKKERDARNILGLGASGSEFSAGFTVIVDDVTSQFELSPSKQDLIFQDYENEVGENHEKNLYSWIGAWCHFRYKVHEKAFGEKRLLGNRVASLASSFQDKEPTFSLSSGSFNRLMDVAFSFSQTTGRIRARRMVCTLEHGKDVVQLKPQPTTVAQTAPSARGRGRPARSASRNMSTQEDDDNNEDRHDNGTNFAYSPLLGRRRSETVQSRPGPTLPGRQRVSPLSVDPGQVNAMQDSRKRRFSDRDDGHTNILPLAARSAVDVIDQNDDATGILGSAHFEMLQLKNRVSNLEAQNHQLTLANMRLRRHGTEAMRNTEARLKQAEAQNRGYLQRLQHMEHLLAQQQQIINLQTQQSQVDASDPLNDPLHQLQDLDQQF